MPVTFNSVSLVPAPLVNLQEDLILKEGTTTPIREYTFTLNGTIVNIDTVLDSPGASGTTGMIGILAEQSRIRSAFDGRAGLLVIQSPQGTTNQVQAYCRTKSVTFPPGTWVNKCEYTIVLTADSLVGESGILDQLTSNNENWSVTENEDGTYAINHQVQAKGRLITFDNGTSNDPLAAAKQWVSTRTYKTDTAGSLTENVTGSGVMNMANLINPLPTSDTNFWNRSIVENVDPIGYTWSITENFVYYASGNAREESSTTVALDNTSTKATISVNGSVFGYSDKIQNVTARYTNAKNKFATTVEPNLYLRSVNFAPSGYTVNPTYLSKQVTYEPNLGNVRYAIVFTSAVGSGLIPNSTDESVNISDTGPIDVFAQLQIPGRSKGTLIQNMKTTSLPTRTVSISASILSSGTITINSLLAAYLAKPDTSAIVNALKPSSINYYYVTQDSEDWNPIKKQYARVVSWTIASSGLAVSGVPSAIRSTEP